MAAGQQQHLHSWHCRTFVARKVAGLAFTTTLSGPVTSGWTAHPTARPNIRKSLHWNVDCYILRIFQLPIFNFMPLNVLCMGRGPHFSPASLKLWFFQSSKARHNPCLHYPVPPIWQFCYQPLCINAACRHHTNLWHMEHFWTSNIFNKMQGKLLLATISFHLQ